MTRRLLAIGGGGFTSSIRDLPLDRWALSLAGVERPKVCLLPTASGDPEHQIRRFYAAFGDTGAELSHVSLFRLGDKPMPLADHLLEQDVIYAGGGSLVNLMALWRAHGLTEVLPAAWRRGTVLCGVSAGAMCWFEGGVTRSHGRPRPATGLGLLPGSLSVHDDVDPERAEAYRMAVADGGLAPGYALDDGIGLLFEDGRVSAITARAGAGARRIHGMDGRLREEALQPALLEAPDAVDATEVSIAELRELRSALRERAARRAG